MPAYEYRCNNCQSRVRRAGPIREDVRGRNLIGFQQVNVDTLIRRGAGPRRDFSEQMDLLEEVRGIIHQR